MLPRSWRLSRSEFIRVKSAGKPHRLSHFSYTIIHNSLNHNRYSVVISAKLISQAVGRNRLRRQIYQTLAFEIGHWDIIIYPQPAMLKLSYGQISSLFNSFLPKTSSS